MPRKPRRIEPGCPYHLISRFTDQRWFIKADSDREYYLKLLGNALRDSDWRLLSYAVMSNHIHLVAIAGTQPLAEWARAVHSPFASAVNRSNERVGQVFVRGPKAYLTPAEALKHLIAYVHNNPVRAGVCREAIESTWTSHRAYLDRSSCPPWLHCAEALATTGFDDARLFDAWVNDPERAQLDASFTEQHYEREAANGLIVDSGGKRKGGSRAEAIVVATVESLGITTEQLRSNRRQKVERLARAVAVRCASNLAVSGRAIASALNLSQQRVSVLVHRAASQEVAELCALVTKRIEGESGSSSA